MRLLIGVCVSAMLAAALAAQAPQNPAKAAPQQPTFRTGVNFVRVDVYPTAGGKAVADLKQDEFEVVEDGVPQRIETFERIVARAAGVEPERGEARSQEESDAAAADPRTRLFVLFFDTLHTAGTSRPDGGPVLMTYDPRTLGRALAKFLDDLIGPDDLVGLMRPETHVDTLLFTRRPATFADFLMSGAEWQKRFLEFDVDDTERNYKMCYPAQEESDIGTRMIARRREMLMIEGLRSLVTHLGNLREGRKAVIVVSEGWTLFTPDRALERPLKGQIPTGRPIGIKDGQPVMGDPYAMNMRAECERDRLLLARIDNERTFKNLIQDANRANVTFYTVDPQGLTTQQGFPRTVESLRTLATATDGISLTTSNDFAPGLSRIRDDLSAYYLLGYNSSNTKYDGRFRSISVRVKRPGVAVRARPGYLAPTEEEVAARARAEAPRDPEVELREKALSSLGTERPDRSLRVGAGYGFGAQDVGTPARHAALWVIGEMDAAAMRTAEWMAGGDATLIVTAADGRTVATEQAAITTTAPRFLLHLPAPLAPGDYLVKVRVRGKAGSAADAGNQVRVTVPDVSGGSASVLGHPLLLRRGPYSGVGFQPTADLRFRKAERIRVDIPSAGAIESVTAQLLDRRGQVLPIPVTTGQREDGQRRFITAEVALAPLAAADYLLQVTARLGDRGDKIIAAFRIIP